MVLKRLQGQDWIKLKQNNLIRKKLKRIYITLNDNIKIIVTCLRPGYHPYKITHYLNEEEKENFKKTEWFKKYVLKGHDTYELGKCYKYIKN